MTLILLMEDIEAQRWVSACPQLDQTWISCLGLFHIAGWGREREREREHMLPGGAYMARGWSRGVQPMAHKLHAAQDGYECSPTQNHTFN